jgi:hypothetical protein
MVKTLLHRVKDVQPLSERALSRGIVVVVVVVLHGDLWCNHAYACAQYHAARFLPVPSRQLCPNTILQPSIKASHIGRQPTQLHCALFASPVRIARKGAFNFLLSSQSFNHGQIVSSVQLSAPFREHESSHRLLCAACFPVCFGLYMSIPVLLCVRSLS